MQRLLKSSKKNEVNKISNSGKISVCATPIGNLDDCSKRLISVFNDCDCVYCEDTRVTRNLLSSLGIKKPLFRLDDNVIDAKTDEVIKKVEGGQRVVYCSDAGTPGVSDPGLKLVSAAHESKIKVEVIPGACAVISAYVASGFCNPKFAFWGFVPRKDAARVELFENKIDSSFVNIFYESPNRIVSTLKSLNEVMPDRRAAVCRELTKVHEEVVVGRVSELMFDFENRDSIKGEIVLVLDSESKTDHVTNDSESQKLAIKLAKDLSQAGLKTSQISSILKRNLNLSKKSAYNIALEAKN